MRKRVVRHCSAPIKQSAPTPRVYSGWNGVCVDIGQPRRMPQVTVNQNSERTFVLMASQKAVRLDLGEILKRDVAVKSV